ncbi:MAG TPA: hypothetical protein VFL73_12055 [Solirubrobacteraceae bacterium]|jgi:hypothetical protein|nr:hypothetical protein [Solirubrobacteraceae bacterium]
MSTHVQQPHAAAREHVARHRVQQPRHGGSRGNELLTSANAVLLLALLLAQGVTVLALDSMIHIHLFVGVVLLGPVALKLSSTGYRFARYYTGAREYRAAGPPPTLLRAIAPIFVFATVGLFGSGIAMLLRGEGGGLLGSVHVASFWVWLGCLAVHVTFNAREVMTMVRSHWLAHARERVAGAELRAALVLGSLLGGVLLAIALLSKITGWHGD